MPGVTGGACVAVADGEGDGDAEPDGSGFGAAVPEPCGVTVVVLVKSFELSLVSAKFVRTSAFGVVVPPATVAGAVSKLTAEPYPRKSTTSESAMDPPGSSSASATLARKSWPDVPPGLSVLVRSVSGSTAPVVPLPGSPIRKYPPGSIRPLSCWVLEAEAFATLESLRYCSDHPLRSCAVSPAL